MGLIGLYLDLQRRDSPTGPVERNIEIDERGRASREGAFVAGDLSGVPLLELAGER